MVGNIAESRRIVKRQVAVLLVVGDEQGVVDSEEMLWRWVKLIDFRRHTPTGIQSRLPS